MNSRRTAYGPAVFLLAMLLSIHALFTANHVLAQNQADGIWLDVDTKHFSVAVMQGEEAIRIYDNVAIGSNGATWNKRLGDEKTPLGIFRLTDIRSSTRFSMFMAIDYPNVDHIRRAYKDKRIGDEEYQRLMSALKRGAPVPQDTSLGGHLGIHGIGAGNSEIHRQFNWTDGCVALTNEELKELQGWVRIGTRVRIH